MAQQFQQPPSQEVGRQYEQRTPRAQFGQQPQTQVSQQPQARVGQQPQRFERPSLQQYEKTMPSEFRVALHDFNTLAEVADWCRDQCLDKGPQLANVARTCQDLTDVAELNEKLITHDSAYGPHLAEAFLRIAQQSIQELQQYQQDPAVADTIPVVRRAVESTEKLLRSVGWQTQAAGQQTGQQLQPAPQQTVERAEAQPVGQQY